PRERMRLTLSRGAINASEANAASDALDARVVAAARVSVVLRPMPIVGVGYGVLLRFVGEAHGTAGVAGADAATLAIRGEAVGEVDDFPSDIELMLVMLAAYRHLSFRSRPFAGRAPPKIPK